MSTSHIERMSQTNELEQSFLVQTIIVRNPLNSSCSSLPESINSSGNRSLGRDNVHYSSQFLPDTVSYVTFDDSKPVSTVADNDRHTNSQSENDVFMTDGENEEGLMTDKLPHIYDSIKHFSTSSSGYVSTSPTHEAPSSSNGRHNSIDHGYVQYNYYENLEHFNATPSNSNNASKEFIDTTNNTTNTLTNKD